MLTLVQIHRKFSGLPKVRVILAIVGLETGRKIELDNFQDDNIAVHKHYGHVHSNATGHQMQSVGVFVTKPSMHPDS